VLTAVLALLSAAAPRSAAAQGHRPFDLALSGGPTFLTGADRGFYKVGYHGQISALVPIHAAGFTLRADAIYLDVPGRDRSTQTVAGAPDTLLIGDLNVFGGALSAVVYPGSPSASVRPYLNVGGGLYRVESEGILYGQKVSGTETKFGVLGGVGVTFPVGRTRAFAEARVHNIFADGGSARIYPVSLGLIF
jgi:hypothetical protein